MAIPPSNETARYFERFGFCGRLITEPPHDDLGIIVVIPCFDEPELNGTLRSLWECARPSRAVEVITVINSSENSDCDVLMRNEAARVRAEEWARGHSADRFRFHILNFPRLPAKRAGVGLARKIGMDEALRRFDEAGRISGVIACFDADCRCDPNYLTSIERHFEENPGSPGASLYFEHPLAGPGPARVYEGIALYELHLRYYVEALRWAGFPHAFHTIGSSMAVRARAYREQGGMNKRQAGEDFYFLHKIIPLGGFGEINETRVLASPRPSHRVPFGTGRAVQEYLSSGRLETYPLGAFDELKQLFEIVPLLFENSEAACRLSGPMRGFLEAQDFEGRLAELRANTRALAAFGRRFFRWFDGFLAMKYIHYSRDRHHGPGELAFSAAEMCRRRSPGERVPEEPGALLPRYRELQRKGSGPGSQF